MSKETKKAVVVTLAMLLINVVVTIYLLLFTQIDYLKCFVGQFLFCILPTYFIAESYIEEAAKMHLIRSRRKRRKK